MVSLSFLHDEVIIEERTYYGTYRFVWSCLVKQFYTTDGRIRHA